MRNALQRGTVRDEHLTRFVAERFDLDLAGQQYGVIHRRLRNKMEQLNASLLVIFYMAAKLHLNFLVFGAQIQSVDFCFRESGNDCCLWWIARLAVVKWMHPRFPKHVVTVGLPQCQCPLPLVSQGSRLRRVLDTEGHACTIDYIGYILH